MWRWIGLTLLSVAVIADGRAVAQSSVDEVVLDCLRVVEDPDGYTNLRTGPSVESKVAGRVLSGTVIAVVPEKGVKWMKVEREEMDSDAPYIHGSRLRRIDQWKVKAFGDWSKQGEATLSSGGVSVTVKEIPFVEAGHHITKHEDGYILVDGLFPWGRDGGLPRQSMKLEVSVGGKAVKLPVDAVKNLYEPNPGTLTIVSSPTIAGHFLVIMSNSDGAGGYVVAWAFKDGNYMGRAVINPY